MMDGMVTSLVVCPGCTCHVRASETSCPLCARDLRRAPGSSSLPRTAAAIAMGLVAAAAMPGCGEVITAEYGIGPTGAGASSVSSGGGDGGSGGSGGEGGATTSTESSTASGTATGTGGEGGIITAPYGIGPGGAGD